MLSRLKKTSTPQDRQTSGDILRVALLVSNQVSLQLDLPALYQQGCSLRVVSSGLAAFSGNRDELAQTDVLVVQIDVSDEDALNRLEAFTTRAGVRLPVVAAVDGLSITSTRKLLRLGVVDVLPLPFTAEDLAQAVELCRDKLSEVRKVIRAPSRRGKVISVMGALGGIGASMVSTQVAQIWAASRDVLLMDMDIQRASVGLYTNLKPKLTIRDIFEADDRLDTELVRMVAVEHVSKANVIVGPEEIIALDTASPGLINRLLDITTTEFSVTVLDMPGFWLDWTAAVMQRSDVILLVTEMTVNGLQHARKQLDMFDANGLSKKVRVVLNRMSPSLFGRYEFDEAQDLLRVPVSYALANDYMAVSAALEEGKAVRKVKIKARLDRDLRQMVEDLEQDLKLSEVRA